MYSIKYNENNNVFTILIEAINDSFIKIRDKDYKFIVREDGNIQFFTDNTDSIEMYREIETNFDQKFGFSINKMIVLKDEDLVGILSLNKMLMQLKLKALKLKYKR